MNAHHPLGFEFDPPPIRTAATPDRDRALSLARESLQSIVYDTVALEGNPFTPAEVRTLMSGITVGGHRVEDAAQVENTARAWKELFRRVKGGTFDLSADTAYDLHALAAREEALEWGAFRTGRVGIAGTKMEPPPADTLPGRYAAGRAFLEGIESPHARAIGAFLFVSANQFFWDGNKRTGRLLMNGVLLSAGMGPINVPAKRQQEFDETMTRFYDTADGNCAVPFLVSCSADRSLRIGQARAGTEPEGQSMRAQAVSSI